MEQPHGTGRMLAVLSVALSFGGGGCAERECRESFFSQLTMVPEEQCPLDSATAVATMWEVNDWAPPSRDDEEFTARFVERNISDALMVCWYGAPADQLNCSEGLRESYLASAQACYSARGNRTSANFRSDSISFCDGNTRLHGDVLRMDDPEHPMGCPARSAAQPDYELLGSDLYPSCATCLYTLTATWTCKTSGLGAPPIGL